MNWIFPTTLVSCIFASQSSAMGCDEAFLAIAGTGEAVAVYSVSVADERDEMALGLMHVGHLDPWKGMLFVFPETGEVSFWMKNTLIPLDMIFIDERGIIAHIHENAIPHDRTSIISTVPVRYVLEINGGQVSKNGIEVGSTVLSSVMNTFCMPERRDF